MGHQTLEYGHRGVAALMVPLSGSTLEPEMAVLLDPGTSCFAMRMPLGGGTGFDAESMRERGRQIGDYAGQFGSIPVDVVGFGLTATSYLMDEGELAGQVRIGGREVPVIYPARALRAALTALGARRIALVSPYWPELTAQAVAYYGAHGFEVAEVVPIAQSTQGHPIYGLRAGAVLQAARQARRAGAEAVVITGTGLPTLAALAHMPAGEGPPVISANLAVGWAMSQVLRGGPLPIRDWLGDGADWKRRLRERHPQALAAAA